MEIIYIPQWVELSNKRQIQFVKTPIKLYFEICVEKVLQMNKLHILYFLVVIFITTSLEYENCSQQSFEAYLQSYNMKCGEQCEEYQQ